MFLQEEETQGTESGGCHLKTDKGRIPCGDGNRLGLGSCKTRTAKDCWQYEKLRRGHGTDFFLETSRVHGPVDTLISYFWPSEL